MPRTQPPRWRFSSRWPTPCTPPPWEVTRKTVIHPLHGDLHRHLPTFVRQRDLDAVLGRSGGEVPSLGGDVDPAITKRGVRLRATSLTGAR